MLFEIGELLVIWGPVALVLWGGLRGPHQRGNRFAS